MTTLAELIGVLQGKLANLSTLRTSAERLGDLERVAALDAELTETQVTLDALLAE
ncbi:MAG: hypothetical protein ACK54C_02170 [Betaproteobacteria bacterium]